MNVDRYLAIVNWARARYTVGGVLMIADRGMVPSTYSRIERAAWDRYMRLTDDDSSMLRKHAADKAGPRRFNDARPSAFGDLT